MINLLCPEGHGMIIGLIHGTRREPTIKGLYFNEPSIIAYYQKLVKSSEKGSGRNG